MQYGGSPTSSKSAPSMVSSSKDDLQLSESMEDNRTGESNRVQRIMWQQFTLTTLENIYSTMAMLGLVVVSVGITLYETVNDINDPTFACHSRCVHCGVRCQMLLPRCSTQKLAYVFSRPIQPARYVHYYNGLHYSCTSDCCTVWRKFRENSKIISIGAAAETDQSRQTAWPCLVHTCALRTASKQW